MFKFIVKKLKEIGLVWKTFKKTFSKATLFHKIITILVIIIQLDVFLFVVRNSYHYTEFLNNYKNWEENINKIENEEKNKNIIKNNVNKIDSNQTDFANFKNAISTLEKNENVTLQNILKNENIYKNIRNIYIINLNEEYINVKVTFDHYKDFSINYIPKTSFINNIEPQFIDKNINYKWTTTKELDSTNRNDQMYIKPVYQPLPFIFLPFLINEFFSILMILVLIYMMEKSGSLGSSQNKFEILFPENIKGDMNDLIGMEEIKEDIIQLKDLIYDREKYKKLGIDKTFNIMFSGPPGTGKTKIASYLSKSLGIPMIIGTGNVETGYLAGGANTLKELFKTGRAIAEQSPQKTCIIFLDEAQVLLRKRGMGRDKWSDDSANELLAQLDGVNTKNDVDIIFIAASNFDDSNMDIDEAMDRRFKKKIFFRLPNRDERALIFEFYLNKIEKEWKNEIIDYKYVSEISTQLSPAKIETIIQKAGMLAIKNKELVSTELIVKSFENVMIGDTTRKTTEKQEDVRKIVIYHELGHFITDFDNQIEKFGLDIPIIKENIRILKISSESISKYKALGYVLNSEEEVGLKTKKDLENEVISLYGGLAAEVHFLNDDNEETDNVTTGSFNDIEKISKILKYMIMDLGMYSNMKINLSIVNIKNDEENIESFKNISEKLFNSSLDKIKKHEELIRHIYPILLDKWVLNKEELFKIIEDFYFPMNKNKVNLSVNFVESSNFDLKINTINLNNENNETEKLEIGIIEEYIEKNQRT